MSLEIRRRGWVFILETILLDFWIAILCSLLPAQKGWWYPDVILYVLQPIHYDVSLSFKCGGGESNLNWDLRKRREWGKPSHCLPFSPFCHAPSRRSLCRGSWWAWSPSPPPWQWVSCTGSTTRFSIGLETGTQRVTYGPRIFLTGGLFPRKKLFDILDLFAMTKVQVCKHNWLKFYRLTILDPQVSPVKRSPTCLVDFAQFLDRLFGRQPGASGAVFHSRRLQTQRRA